MAAGPQICGHTHEPSRRGSAAAIVAVLACCTHGVSHRGLQRRVLLGLAADVVEGEEQVVVIRQVGGNLHLDLLVELWRPWEGRGGRERERGRHRKREREREREVRGGGKRMKRS